MIYLPYRDTGEIIQICTNTSENETSAYLSLTSDEGSVGVLTLADGSYTLSQLSNMYVDVSDPTTPIIANKVVVPYTFIGGTSETTSAGSPIQLVGIPANTLAYIEYQIPGNSLLSEASIANLEDAQLELDSVINDGFLDITIDFENTYIVSFTNPIYLSTYLEITVQ